MTWVDSECVECGTSVTYGIYYSEYDHEDTEIDVTVKCGYCVNGWTQEDIASEKEDTDKLEFVERCMEDDLFLCEDLPAVLKHVDNKDIEGALNLTVDLFYRHPEYRRLYAETYYNIVKTFAPKMEA